MSASMLLPKDGNKGYTEKKMYSLVEHVVSFF